MNKENNRCEERNGTDKNSWEERNGTNKKQFVEAPSFSIVEVRFKLKMFIETSHP